MSNNYNEDSIQSLDFLTAVREKSGMYLGGGLDESALTHCAKEAISNSIDEHLAGYGNLLEIKVDKNSFYCRDYGRGIPFGSLEDVATKPHTGGKLKKTKDSSYTVAAGTNGVGIKLLTAIGNLQLSSIRNGERIDGTFSYTQSKVGSIIKTTEKNGTIVDWQPDKTLFKNYTFNVAAIKQVVEEMLYLIPTLKVKFNGKLLSKSGTLDFLKDNLNSAKNLTQPYSSNLTYGNATIKIAMVWNSVATYETTYVNLVPTVMGGSHLTAFKSTLTREFNKYFQTDFSGDDIRKYLSLIIGVETPLDPIFSGQSKEQLKMPEITPDLNICYKTALEEMFSKDEKGFKSLIKLLTKLQKAQNTDKLLKQIVSKPKNKFTDLTTKYDGCKAKTGIELFITEGLSAKSALKLCRADNQAVYAVRGKALNIHDLEKEDVLKNEEIVQLIAILGDPSEAVKKFDKIVITTDADHDGEHIEVLIFAILVRFYKELLFAGKIYGVELPQFMGEKNGKVEFAFDEKEKKEKLKGHNVSFLKGLGEMDAEQLAPFVLNEKTRHLKQLSCKKEDYEELIETLGIAFGKSKENRKTRKEMFSI